VDKDRFPSDTLSTHAIQPAGVQVLERIGVLDALVKVAPPMMRGRIIFDDAVAVVDDVPGITGAPVLSVRRITLDEILVKAAAAAGAEVRTQTAVTGLVMDRGRVTGVTTPAGELRAPLVVGADGTRSAVARMVGAKEYHPTPNGRVFMWAYYEADPTSGFAAGPSCMPGSRGRGARAASTRWPTCTASSARPRGPAGRSSAMQAISRTPRPARESPTLFASPRSWQPRSSGRSEAAPGRPTRSCTTGGTGATRTLGRCTGSPTTRERPARRRRCCARPSGKRGAIMREAAMVAANQVRRRRAGARNVATG
jgi:2-polyprenyl-6-methoxyphenol hydroxylase-like FAD-dependent oxidoreductase